MQQQPEREREREISAIEQDVIEERDRQVYEEGGQCEWSGSGTTWIDWLPVVGQVYDCGYKTWNCTFSLPDTDSLTRSSPALNLMSGLYS